MEPTATTAHSISQTDIPPWWGAPFTRTILNESLLRMPHVALYHYTTQAGLLGIVTQKEIWATHTQYLNDRQEFRHALGVFREQLDDLVEACEMPYRTKCFEDMRSDLSDDVSSTNVCVSSFSEDRDSLSQWRAYGGNSGFALGFPGEFLASLVGSEYSYLAPCIYDPAQQRLLARALLDEVADQNLLRAKNAPDKPDRRPGGSLSAYLLRFAPLLKHESFASEREWRIITRPLMCLLPRFEFRAGSSQIIPYYRFPLAEEDKPFRVSEIVVGPAPHELQSLASVRSFLVRHELEDTVVSNSRVPYRNW